VALEWMEKGVRKVTTVYGGVWAMRSAGFDFLYPKRPKQE